MRDNIGQERASIHDLTIMIRYGKIDISNISQVIDSAIKYLRAHEWVRLDDVVEGVWKCTYKSQCNFNKKGICRKAESRWKNDTCVDQIPATIGDLING